MNSTPLVSVVLPIKTFNPEISLALKSIYNQTYRNIELVVITSDSKVKKILKNTQYTLVNCSCNKSKARNRGSEVAKGTYLFHIDKDMILEPTVIQDCITLTNKGAQAIVLIENEKLSNGLINKTRILEKKIVSHDTIIESPRFIEKKLFHKIHGFDELLDPIDDGDLKAKLEENNIKTYKIKSIIHIIPNNRTTKLRDRFSQMFERGKKAPLFNLIHKNSKQFKPLSRLHFYYTQKDYLLENLWISLVLFVLKFFDLFFFKFGTLFTSKKDRELISEIKNNKIYEKTASSYQSEFYEATLGARYVNKEEMEIVKSYLNKIDKNKHLSILDIGAGGGRWSKLLLDEFPNSQIVACDLSNKMINNLKLHFVSYKKRFSTIKADMQYLPFEKGSFDLVLSIRSIKYAQNQNKVFKEIYRVLKRNGKAIIELPYYNLVYKIIKYVKVFGILSDYANRIVLKEKNYIEKNLADNFEIKDSTILFTIPSTLYKKIDNYFVLNSLNVINKILSKNIFGRSLFYLLDCKKQ